MSTLITISNGQPATTTTTLSRHPLEPLSGDEVRAAVELLKSQGKVTPTTRFVSIALEEPDKAKVHGWNGESSSLPRQAFAVLFDNATNSCYEALHLADRRTGSLVEARPGRPADHDHRRAGRMRAGRPGQPRVQGRAQEAYGVDDTSLVDGRHLERGQLRLRRGPHPAAGPAALLSAHRSDRQRLRPADRGTAAGRRPEHDGSRFASKNMATGRCRRANATTAPIACPNQRTDIKPLEITQPDGPSFEVDGYQVRWQKWSFVIGFNAREGLTLHHLRYNDERPRPLDPVSCVR